VEGSASNVVAVIGGAIVSPGRADGALAGITRSVVLEEARRLGRSVEERGVEPAELGTIAELLLTSSVREVVPVVGIDGRPVGEGTPGPIGRELTERYRAVVRKETGYGR
jgi:branched-subunit amino acid aminotransferase/4-amino-4-deoxychorismate lyase